MPSTTAPWRPLRVTALATMAVCLGLGLLLGRLTGPAPAVDEPIAVEAPTDRAVPETEVLGAVETRAAELVPVPVDHLVIVSVSVTTCGERLAGTGVLVAENTILTAAHNVGDAGLVRIAHGTQILTGEGRGVFVDGRDLAVVELPAPLAEPVATAAFPTEGDAVTVVGFPNGGARSSVVGPAVRVPELAARLWAGPLGGVDAVTRSGMSGGPVLDADGALVGLLVAAQPETGTAVVAAIDDVEAVLDAPLTDGRCPATA